MNDVEPPISLPEWEQEYEIWYGEKPYKIATLHVSAATVEEARQSAEYVIREVLPRTFPGAIIVITTPINPRKKR